MARNQAKEGYRKLFARPFWIFMAKKIEMTWNIAKNGTAEPELKHIKNIFWGHKFEDGAITQFQIKIKCKTRCEYLYFANDMRYGSSPNALAPLGILLEVKTRVEGSLPFLESLDNVPQYFVQCQLQMICTDTEFWIMQSYCPETKT